VALVVASVRQPVVRPALIDRFCIVAQRGDMTPVVVFNKIDLGAPDAEVVAELQDGRIVFVPCSAQTGAGLDELAAVLRGKRSVLVGPSGAGKSSLVNALVPGADLATREIRFKDQRGRHVTATASIHQLPGGGQIVDTPGVRELAMGMTPDQAPWYFPEIEALLGRCKFNDCTHTHEPHCAVIAAVASGAISARRYQSYLRILESI
jgi:ribosome biogenesis GTPase